MTPRTPTLVCAFATAICSAVDGQSPSPTPPARFSLSGIVFDSLVTSGRVSGAEVLVDGVSRGATDAQGRFRVDGVAPGEHEITFASLRLDSLGVSIPARTINVATRDIADLVLATPSAGTVHERFCSTADSSTALLVGRVRDAATSQPLAGVRVSTTWMVWTLGSGRMQRDERTAAAETDADGSYRICGVPNDVTTALQARRGVNATGVIGTALGGRRVGFRPLSLSLADSVPVVALLDSAAQVRITGRARLTGTVVGAGGRPVAGARVRLIGVAGEARTDSAGRFSMTQLPAGTQSIQVLSIGVAPALSTVDLVPDGSARTIVVMDPSAVGLQVVTVVGRPVRSTDVNGFESRRRGAVGTFITREDIERRHPLQVSDLFAGMPGMRVSHVGFSTVIESTRSAGIGKYGVFGCAVQVVIDGMPAPVNPGQPPISIDHLVHPNDVEGIEVYNSIGMPVMFRAAGIDRGCGVIAIWTRRGM